MSGFSFNKLPFLQENSVENQSKKINRKRNLEEIETDGEESPIQYSFPSCGPWLIKEPLLSHHSTRLQPWLDENHCSKKEWSKIRFSPFLESLHHEILLFQKFIDRQRKISDKPRKSAAGRYCSVLSQYFAENRMEFRAGLFGSSATGLFLPATSDIDIAIYPLNNLEITQGFASSLLSKKITKIVKNFAKDMLVLRKTKIPLIKCRDRKSDINVDISIQGKHQTLDAVRVILNLKSREPYLTPLVLVIKQFLLVRGLNSNSEGGLGGYGLVLLIAGFLKIHPSLYQHMPFSRHGIVQGMEESKLSDMRLSLLLLDFFHFFGFIHDYANVGIAAYGVDSKSPTSILFNKKDLGLYNSRASNTLCVLDPLDPTNNVTLGCSKIALIAAHFASAYKSLTFQSDQFKLALDNIPAFAVSQIKSLAVMNQFSVPKASFRVYKTNDARTIVENPWRDFDNVLEIKDTGLTIGNREEHIPTSNSAIMSVQEIMGIIGVIELSFGKYLLVITARTLVATLQNHKIWKITGGLAIPIGAGAPVTDTLEEEDLGKFTVDKEILESIKNIIHSGRLYYSSTYDMTHSLQHNYFSKNGKPSATIIDNRYFFNEYLLKSLTLSSSSENDISPWITKIIAGFAGMIEMDSKDGPTTEKAHTYQVLLISRINHRRLGTRYVRRGLDSDGNAANNVEMEQIVFNHDYLKDKSISSFSQLRGSVPSIWGQDLDLSYRPRLVLADINKEEIWSATSKHYQDLKHQYIGEKSFSSGADNGLVVCVNLLDDTGFEGPLTEIYESSIKRFNDPKFRYESFPMNKWCKKMNFTNMEILLDRVRLPLINSGWFVAEGELPGLFYKGSLRVSKIQTGATRVSCLDSLDRTNLTCSIFARYMIPYQVQSIAPGLPAVQVIPATGVGVNEVRDPVSAQRKALEGGYPLLTNLWADSGDSISLMYAGTGALKADVTRTGKRQVFQGSYADGVNSLTRYFLNNFTHGYLQDIYDLLTGKTKIDEIKSHASREGPKKADRIKRPLICRSSFPGSLIPSSVLSFLEPIYFNYREIAEKKSEGKPKESGPTMSLANQLVLTLKELAPERVDNLLQLIFALTIFFWVLVITKFVKIQGQLVVNTPRFSRELSTLKELAKR